MRFTKKLMRATSAGTLAAYLGLIFQPAAKTVAAIPAASGPGHFGPPVIKSSKPAFNTPPPVAPPQFLASLPDVPSDSDLISHRGLAVPFVRDARKTFDNAKRRSLGRALERYAMSGDQPVSQRLQILTDLLAVNPDMDYAGTLWLEVATTAGLAGNFSLAMAAARHAWNASKEAPADERPMTEMAETALSELVVLYTRTGQKESLEALLAEIESRAPHPLSSSNIMESRAALKWWKADPAANILCGITAYNMLASKAGTPLLDKHSAWTVDAQHPAWAADADHEAEEKAERQEFIAKGMSAARLLARISNTGADYHLVKRISGAAIPVPSVAHLTFGGGGGHYSAVLQTNENSALIADPYLRFSDRMENTTLNSQSSGFFIVARSVELPPGFVEATQAESLSIYGRASCPYGFDCSNCNSPTSECHKMTVYSLSEYLPGVILRDQPIPYEPMYGPRLNFTLTYRQIHLENDDSQTAGSNLGPRWTHSFQSYLRAESGGTPSSATSMRWVNADGTFFKYANTGYNTWSKDYSSIPSLTAGSPGYVLTFGDGSIMEFGHKNTPTSPTRYYLSRMVDSQGLAVVFAYDGSNRLTQITDATGNITSLTYETDNLIRSIVDPFNRAATFTYGSSGMLESITDPLGIKSSFTYDASNPDQVTKLTTPYGDTTFEYEGTPTTGYDDPVYHGWSVTATDPLGQVEKMQNFYESGDLAAGSALDVELRQHAPPSSVNVDGTSVPFFNLDTGAGGGTPPNHFHVSFHWSKKYWGEYQKALETNPNVNPKDFAEATLWLMKPFSFYSTSVPFATKKPNQAMVWYNYDGQTATTPFLAGTHNQPIKSVRQIEDSSGVSTWVMTQQTYNAVGAPLVSTDELGRKTQLVYVTGSDIDVWKEQVWNTTAWATTKTYTYPTGTANHHLPATVLVVSGQTTTFTRNAMDQVTQVQVTNTSTEKVRYTYDTSGTSVVPAWPGNPGLLRKVEKTSPVNPANWVTTDIYTYDYANRVRTHEDASGDVLTFDYDDFDRPTLVTYPDSTTEQFSYQRGYDVSSPQSLELTAQKDRYGRWTIMEYNAVRDLVRRTTPDGKSTRYDWCKCGSIWKLTDPLNRVTEWKRDILGRVTDKIMPDGITKTSYAYQARSGRLATITRPIDQSAGTPTVSYSYNLDGTLKKEDYTDSGTPDVTYSYLLSSGAQDPLGRLTSVTDGIGTHVMTYVALVAGNEGAGQLSSLDGPLVNDDYVYTYDWRNRLSVRKLQSDAAAQYRSETLTWDSLGRAKTVVNQLGAFTYDYNSNLDRPDTLTRPVLGTYGIVTSFFYFDNNAGLNAQKLRGISHDRKLTATTSIKYSSHTLGYDTAGRISTWAKTASPLTGTPADSTSSFGYDLSDQVTSYTNAVAGESQQWSYDSDGNWLSIGNPSSMSARIHDNMNRLTQIGGAGKTVVEGNVSEPADVTVTSGTALPQTASVTKDATTSTYRFRAEVTVQEGQNDLTIAAKDHDATPNTTTQRYKFNASGVSRAFTYDANGNMLTDTSGRSFTWDAKNRLKSVTVGGNTTRWDYDYQDRRVKEYNYPANSLTTALAYINPSKLYIWDGADLVQERSVTGATQALLTASLNAGGTITRTHYFGGFTNGATGATRYQTTTDHLGNIREVIAASGTTPAIGTVVARYEYSVFQGPTKVYSAPVGNVDASLLTIGRYYHHAGTNLELALYRAYDPALGRWLSEDPIGEKGGLNLYGFVANSPSAKKDFFGHIVGIDDAIELGLLCAAAAPIIEEEAPIIEAEAEEALEAAEATWESAVESAESSYEKMVEFAKQLYPKLAAKADQLHHECPKYLGGAADGPLVRIPAAYHQMITNAFRSLWGYGQGPVSPEQQQQMMNNVYNQYPLP